MNIISASDIPPSFFTYAPLQEKNAILPILHEVRTSGDAAIRKYTQKYDRVSIDSLKVSPTDIEHAYTLFTEKEQASLEKAAHLIRTFATHQRNQYADFEIEPVPGVFTGQKIEPLERVGIYVPGGRFPLVSSVLMCGIPALVAGVSEIALCSPPTCSGSPHPAILVAADSIGISEIYAMGGVQAIAALAYGTETVKRVDKIVGPGNAYVTAAKKAVFGEVGIDFIAGPTEIMIIADGSASPDIVAADLYAQAEHDPQALPVLVTTSQHLATSVQALLKEHVASLDPTHPAHQSITSNGMIILVSDLEEAVHIANRRAPEHLHVYLHTPSPVLHGVHHYGSLFVGPYAAEVLGDYSSGLNHTLPTNRTARYTGGLSVRDFLKIQTTLRVSETGFLHIGPVAQALAEIEGLEGHARSIISRMKALQEEKDR
jgi:histidinol dehydrogenase